MSEVTHIYGLDVAEFIHGYLSAALWSSNDESDENGGQPFDSNYSIEDFDAEALDRANADCRAFLYSIGYLITEDNFNSRRPLEMYAGHDFWLTRNGHGAGFWDGDWKCDTSDYQPLTKAAKAFAEVNLFAHDGQVGME